MEQGMDPELRKFFLKALHTICYTVFWMFFIITAGLYFKLANTSTKPLWAVIIFYIIAVFTFGVLIRYLVKIWRK